ncbi:Plasma membrane t-SNARE, secretory vesicle fusion [Xylographa soralifera]|nr:Plasma membrane t-SNARE, secretory vesicle fusion [Xylographa soralifera]
MAQYGGYGNQSGYGQTNNRYDQPAGNPYEQPTANPYGQPAANPYDQQATNSYGQQSGNPYGATQSVNPYSQSQPSNLYTAPSGTPYDEEQSMAMRNDNNVPMNNLNGGAGAYGQQKQRDPRQFLNDCRDMNQAIDKTSRNLDDLKRLQTQALNDPDSSSNSQSKRQLASLTSEIQATYRNFVNRVNKLRSTPGADQTANQSHIQLTRTKLSKAMTDFQEANRAYEKNIQEQLKRQYLIVRPDATEAEAIESANANTGEAVFRNALMSDRRGQSQSTLRVVEGRHEELRYVEKKLEEVSGLFTQLNQNILVQEDPIANIANKTDVIHDNVTQGNTQLDGAITKARAANRKKWYCLGIAILIILVIVIIVVVVVEVLKNR